LLSVVELLFLSLRIEVLQGKRCQDSLLSGGGRSLGAKISGEGFVPGEYFLFSTKLGTFCYLTVQTAPCYVPSFLHNTGVWQTDRRTDNTDGIALAITALAMRALRRVVTTCLRRWTDLASCKAVIVTVNLQELKNSCNQKSPIYKLSYEEIISRDLIFKLLGM